MGTHRKTANVAASSASASGYASVVTNSVGMGTAAAAAAAAPVARCRYVSSRNAPSYSARTRADVTRSAAAASPAPATVAAAAAASDVLVSCCASTGVNVSTDASLVSLTSLTSLIIVVTVVPLASLNIGAALSLCANTATWHTPAAVRVSRSYSNAHEERVGQAVSTRQALPSTHHHNTPTPHRHRAAARRGECPYASALRSRVSFLFRSTSSHASHGHSDVSTAT
jgi:hypothetical protein